MAGKILKFTRFGNPILRRVAQRLSDEAIQSSEIQQLITDMRYTVEEEKTGVGLAAPQVGIDKALALIAIKPTPLRPNRDRFESIIINPTYTGVGKRTGMWEGCISAGRGSNTLFGKALRYKTIEASWIDSEGNHHQEILKGLIAHVFQHETDHLNGVLFVDRVRDTTTYMMADEYRKRVAQKS